MRLVHHSVLSFFVAAGLAAAAPAGADDTVTFEYRPSELESEQSARALYERIERRADALCGKEQGYLLPDQKACERDLVEDFVTGIDDARLERIHAARSHGAREPRTATARPSPDES